MSLPGPVTKKRIFNFTTAENKTIKIEADSFENAFVKFAKMQLQPINNPDLIITDTFGNICNCQVKDSVIINKKITITKVDKYLLTKEEVDPFTRQLTESSSFFLMDLLEACHELQNLNHKIKADNYTDIFFTSDIHADYRKFVQLLINGGFIRIPDDIGNLYEGNNIYNPRIISDCEWIKPNCLIVIIGDLVDGRRVIPLYQVQKTDPTATEAIPKAEVTDTVGNFELLLHMLIYNLRLKGQEVNSNIIFTIGNHDMEMLLKSDNYLQEFVHRDALKYYDPKNIGNKSDKITSYDIRRVLLSFFYIFSPYVLLVLQTERNENEILCIHGGIHNKDGDYNLEEIMIIQDTINKNDFSSNGFEILGDLLIDDLYKVGKLGESGAESALRDRYYATGEDLCEKNENFPYSLTVVGHSPSQGNYRELENVQLKGEEYSKCDTKDKYQGRGCIVFKCPLHKTKMPRIVLVDTAMSESLTNNGKGGRTRDDEKTRSIEFLHLSHGEGDEITHFNRMYKYLINNKDKTAQDEIVYPRSYKKCGSSKNAFQEKYLIYKAKYIKLKNNYIK